MYVSKKQRSYPQNKSQSSNDPVCSWPKFILPKSSKTQKWNLIKTRNYFFFFAYSGQTSEDCVIQREEAAEKISTKIELKNHCLLICDLSEKDRHLKVAVWNELGQFWLSCLKIRKRKILKKLRFSVYNLFSVPGLNIWCWLVAIFLSFADFTS